MLYKGRLSKSFLELAAENAAWISEHGHQRGGVRFYGNRDVTFDSDNVDFDAIQAAAKNGDLVIIPEHEGKPIAEERRGPGRPRKEE